MEFNDLEMKAVASFGLGNFTKEGLLFLKEKGDRKGKKPRAFTEHWFKLKGNILYYMKGRERISEPRGLIVLERCTVELDSNETLDYYCFLIVFEGGEPIQLAASTEHERDEWVHSLHTASYECMKMQLQSLREALQGRGGGRELVGGSDNGNNTLDDDHAEPWIEICISCDHLPLRSNMLPPNPMAEVLCITPPSITWTKMGQTEVTEETRNPCFLKTINLTEPKAQAKTIIKVVVYDVIERVTNTRTCIGHIVLTSSDLIGAGEENRIREKISTPTFTDGGFVTLLAWTDPRYGGPNADAGGSANDSKSIRRRTDAVSETRSQSLRWERVKKRDQLKPLFANMVCKSFRFPTINDSEGLDVSELLGESKLTVVLAVEWLKFMRQDSEEWCEQLNQLGMLVGQWERWRLMALEKSRIQQAFYARSIETLQNDCLSKGCSFKASSNKSVKWLEVVPINLHLHRMLVKNSSTDKGPVKRSSAPWHQDPEGSFYDVITVGAFAAHTLKFKDGGLLRHYMQRCQTCVDLCQSSADDQQQQQQSNRGSCSPDGQHLHGGGRRCLRQLSGALSHFRASTVAPLLRAQRVTLDRCLACCCTLRSLFRSEENDSTACFVRGPSLTGVAASHSTASWQDAVAQLKSACNEMLEIADQPLVAEGMDALRTRLGEVRVGELSAASLEDCMDRLPKLLDVIQLYVQRPPLGSVDCAILPSGSGGCDDLEGSAGATAALAAAALRDLTSVENLAKVICQHVSAALTFIMLYDLKDTATFGSEELLLRHDIVVCQAVVTAATGVLAKVRARITDGGMLRRVAFVGLLLEFESLLSCYREEAGMLEDFAVGVQELSSVKFRFVENRSAVDDYGIYCPQLSGSRYEMTVSLPLPSAVYHLLPMELQNGRLFGVVPVLFNIGINEMATVAERFGDLRVQEDINKSSFERLLDYYQRCREVPLSDDSAGGATCDVAHRDVMTVFDYSNSLDELMSRLQQQLAADKSKNVEILHLAAEITRRLDGVRFTSCKSAKDRTAMAVTLEEVQVLLNNESLASHVFLRALECLRSEGVRRSNTFKNTGSLKYAFNSLQLQSFPKLYRPPNGTYGGGET